MTRRRTWVVAASLGLAVAVGGGVLFAVTRRSAHQPTPPPATVPTSGVTTPTVCPLTGVRPRSASVPDRPALAVKIDNVPAARPPAGLDSADMVFEEPVEGGITRLVAVFQCSDAKTVEPIRSARLVDPDILIQFGRPIFAYSGGIDPVTAKVAASPLYDLNAGRHPSLYHRDAKRSSPSNLYSSTAELWAAGAKAGAAPLAPGPMFAFGPQSSPSDPVSTVRLPFSSSSDVTWTWDTGGGRWLRRYDGTPAGPALVVGGAQISAANVVVLKVVVTVSPYVEDPTGVHEWDLTLTGSGTASVYRDGRGIAATWNRPSLADTTRLLDSSGSVITLAPGPTWVELVPTTIAVQAAAA